MALSKSTDKGRAEDNSGTLLSLPQRDIERTPIVRSTSSGNEVGTSNIKNKTISTKTTAKRADLVLFELPKSRKEDHRRNLLEGRCKIMANGQSAMLVTPSSSLQLVTVGTSNALVVWNKDDTYFGKNNTNNAPGGRAVDEESPTKRRKVSNSTSFSIAPCRLIQPGGSGSSFLVGQPYDFDPMKLFHFFMKREAGTFSINDKNASKSSSISTSDLCNLFQVAPSQIWEAMLWIPSVISIHEGINSNGKIPKELEVKWHLVSEEEVLFGQQALIETLCEDDDNIERGDCDENNLRLESTTTIERMAVKVSRRLLPLLMETESSNIRCSDVDKEHRCLAIARKTVLLASSSAYSTSIEADLHDFNHPFCPDTSRIAFYALRDLFLKYPSYAWSDLSQKWSTRLPLGEPYERITSTTEWIEDKKLGGHGGLVPNQLVFSSSASSSVGNSNDERNLGDNTKSKRKEVGNSKAVLSLVNAHAVLTWNGKKQSRV